MKVRLDSEASALVKGRKVQFPKSLAGALVTLAEPPAKSATKPEWVEHAVSQGMVRAAAEAMTKDDLVEKLT